MDRSDSRSIPYPVHVDPFHTTAFASDHPFYKQSVIAIANDIRFPVYRYTKKFFADKFFHSGEVRLNTLRSYHDIEKLGSSVGDESEGFRHFHTHVDGKIGGKFKSTPTVFYADSINAWTICASKSMNFKFYAEFDSDCCIRINSIDYFLEIARVVTNRWLGGSLFPIKYIDTKEIVKDILVTGRSPMLTHTKPRSYKWQNEIRLILEPWSPVTSKSSLTEDPQIGLLTGDPRRNLSRARLFPDLEPLTAYAPNARKYAEIIEFYPLSATGRA
jgi:hypothetical protein